MSEQKAELTLEEKIQKEQLVANLRAANKVLKETIDYCEEKFGVRFTLTKFEMGFVPAGDQHAESVQQSEDLGADLSGTTEDSRARLAELESSTENHQLANAELLGRPKGHATSPADGSAISGQQA